MIKEHMRIGQSIKEDAIPDELHEEWKRKGRYAKGIILMPGKVWRGEQQGIIFCWNRF